MRPIEPDQSVATFVRYRIGMEPTDALRAIEVALRVAIREVLGEPDWLRAQGAPAEDKLRTRRKDESRRDGVAVSDALLDYTDVYHLTNVILSNWERFKPVFADKARTAAYFGFIEDVRNTNAHNRELVPFERDLLSGIAGQLRNQISLYRSSMDRSSQYYPLIESLTDGFGNEGLRFAYGRSSWEPLAPLARLQIGDAITFTGRAFGAQNRSVKWGLQRLSSSGYVLNSLTEMAEGNDVIFEYIVAADDVFEQFDIAIAIWTESPYKRYAPSHTDEKYDDIRHFVYAVNPPRHY